MFFSQSRVCTSPVNNSPKTSMQKLLSANCIILFAVTLSVINHFASYFEITFQHAMKRKWFWFKVLFPSLLASSLRFNKRPISHERWHRKIANHFYSKTKYKQIVYLDSNQQVMHNRESNIVPKRSPEKQWLADEESCRCWSNAQQTGASRDRLCVRWPNS